MQKKAGVNFCPQCKRDRSLADFLPIKRRGLRVVFCSDCASSNMRKWGATSLPRNQEEAAGRANSAKRAAVDD